MDASRFSATKLEQPIVQAPMAGGPSTPALAAAVSGAGGLGFLGAGYKKVDAVAADIEAVQQLTDRPFGINLFAPPGAPADEAQLQRYAASLCDEAERYGVQPGAPSHDDDGWADKLALVTEQRVGVVSFTFGCPPPATIATLQAAGIAAWVTVTTAAEAVTAVRAGADALVVQGNEAGGHRGSFDDAAPGQVGLLALLQLVQAAVEVELVATGGIATGRGVAAVLAAGACAAQLGTAFMLSTEAGTSAAHREALASEAETALTRAFTGRTARGLVNRFMTEHGDDAPPGYPEVHYMTAPLRAVARERGDAEGINLWAGQAHALAPELPAAEIVAVLGAEARAALREAADRSGPQG